MCSQISLPQLGKTGNYCKKRNWKIKIKPVTLVNYLQCA